MAITEEKVVWRHPRSWWHDNWPKHWWLIGSLTMVVVVCLWSVWALSFGVTSRAGWDAKIWTLIESKQRWEKASVDLTRLRQTILANPIAFNDPVGALVAAEQEAKKTTDAFEDAGYSALGGELIIISGVALQVITVLLLVALLGLAGDKWRRQRSMRLPLSKGVKEVWLDTVSKGQILPDEDDILKFLRGESEDDKRSKRDKDRGRQVAGDYKELLARRVRATSEEPPWGQLSRLFYKMALICREGGQQEYSMRIRAYYEQLRTIIWQEIREQAALSIGRPVIFLVLFELLSLAWNWLSGPLLGQQLALWQLPVLLIGGAFAVHGLVHVVGESVARWFTEKTWTDLDDVLVGAVIGPLSAFATAIMILIALDILTGPATPPYEFGPFLAWAAYEAMSNTMRNLVVILAGTWFTVFLLNRVIVWVLDKWAKRTDQKYDDMFVKVIQVFGTFIILAFGIGATLAVFNGPISLATGVDSVVLPYTIIVSVFTAILGYASRAGFENFFGGLLLQIEKPFERGERIILPDGKICDVREVGMRSTVLYNVLENSEVSVPNSEMSRMTISNFSRPDLELRIAIPIWIATDTSELKEAEAVLLDIAYLEEEVDQMREFAGELTGDERRQLRVRRSTIEDEMERLIASHEKIKDTIVSRIVGGGISHPECVFKSPQDCSEAGDPYLQVLKKIRDFRMDYQKALEVENDWISQAVKEVTSSTDVGKDTLRAYRHAVSEIGFYDVSMHAQGETDSGTGGSFAELMQIVARREGIDPEYLGKVLNTLAESGSSKDGVDASTGQALKRKLQGHETQRLGLVLRIGDQVATLSNYIYAIGEQYPDVRPELDLIFSELNKEPAVFSEFTDDGHARVTLNCFALYLERHYEVKHKINRAIERRFKWAGIKFDMPKPSGHGVSTRMTNASPLT